MPIDLALAACPKCGSEDLRDEGAHVRCGGCQTEFAVAEGIVDFMIGPGFEDEPDCAVYENEEMTGRQLAQHYVLPLVKRLFGERPPAGWRALSIGCGVGTDVEVLNDAGFPCWGIDAGNRQDFWARRADRTRYYKANAKNLPYKGEQFDFVWLGCVIPHIGVPGDVYYTSPGYEKERDQAFREAIRVLKPGGRAMFASPNKRCPLDLFHRPHQWTHQPRFHSPRETFLLDYRDYEKALLETKRCRELQTLPLEGYWGFFRSDKYLVGRILQIPIKALFAILSWEWTRALRKTFLNPWLIVMARK